MANVAYTGVQSEAPQSAPPADYQHEQANADAFGGGIAAGAEALGQGALKASQFYGEVAANDATNNTLQKVNNVLYGDPSLPALGPDGKPAPDTGYFGKRGADAMSARGDVTARIDEIIAEGANGLTPSALQAYQNETRRARMQWQREVGSHADQQQRTWTIDTNNTSAVIALNGLARDPLNPDVVARTTESVRGALVKNAQLNGEDAAGAILKADQSIALMQAQSLLPTDPQATLKLLSDKKDLLASTPGYDALYDRTLARVRDVSAHHAADIAMVPGTTGPTTPSGLSVPISEDVVPILKQKFGNAVVTDSGRRPANARYGASDSDHKFDHGIDVRPIQGVTFDQYKAWAQTLGLPGLQVLDETTPEAKARYHSTGNNWHIGWSGNRGGPTPAPSAPSPGQPKPVQTPSDYYRANWAAVQDKARQAYLATPGNENDTEGADRAASLVDTKMRAVITQDDMRIKADYHALDAAAVQLGPNGQLPITVDQLLQNHPDLRDGWENLQLSNPYAAANFENHLLKANSMPANATYGNAFYDIYNKVVTGQIKDAATLLPYIDARKGDSSPLTKEGYGELKNMIGAMATPQGAALTTAERDFFNRIRPNITLTNPHLNMADPDGDKKFNQFMIAALGRIRAEAASGTPPNKIFDPKGDIATLAQNYMMSPLDAANRQIKAFRMPANFGGQGGGAGAPDISTPAGLKAAVAAGLVPKDKATDIAVRNKWIAPPAPQVPTPH